MRFPSLRRLVLWKKNGSDDETQMELSEADKEMGLVLRPSPREEDYVVVSATRLFPNKFVRSKLLGSLVPINSIYTRILMSMQTVIPNNHTIVLVPMSHHQVSLKDFSMGMAQSFKATLDYMKQTLAPIELKNYLSLTNSIPFVVSLITSRDGDIKSITITPEEWSELLHNLRFFLPNVYLSSITAIPKTPEVSRFSGS